MPEYSYNSFPDLTSDFEKFVWFFTRKNVYFTEYHIKARECRVSMIEIPTKFAFFRVVFADFQFTEIVSYKKFSYYSEEIAKILNKHESTRNKLQDIFQTLKITQYKPLNGWNLHVPMFYSENDDMIFKFEDPYKFLGIEYQGDYTN